MGLLLLLAKSGLISMALNVARSCETSWLCARDSRVLFARTTSDREAEGARRVEAAAVEPLRRLERAKLENSLEFGLEA